jgi:hypothetical protein
MRSPPIVAAGFVLFMADAQHAGRAEADEADFQDSLRQQVNASLHD